jgi:hypothetical protein
MSVLSGRRRGGSRSFKPSTPIDGANERRKALREAVRASRTPTAPAPMKRRTPGKKRWPN